MGLRGREGMVQYSKYRAPVLLISQCQYHGRFRFHLQNITTLPPTCSPSSPLPPTCSPSSPSHQHALPPPPPTNMPSLLPLPPTCPPSSPSHQHALPPPPSHQHALPPPSSHTYHSAAVAWYNAPHSSHYSTIGRDMGGRRRRGTWGGGHGN